MKTKPAEETKAALWEVRGDVRRDGVRDLFSQIAPVYDKVNSWMTLGRHVAWRAQAVASIQLQPGEEVLDLCCGTGDFFPPIRAKIGAEGRLVGLDFCAEMLDRARAKDPDAELVMGDATHLPFADAEFNAITVGWGIRNVPDIDAAHREAFRVLRSGGRFVSLDTARPANGFVRWGSTAVQNVLIPFLGRLVGKSEQYRYLPKSAGTFLDRAGLEQSMREAGFVDITWKTFCGGAIGLIGGRKP